ncbi:MAG TPA: SCP2 sterol-binding domain-containing protein [Acidimicrobiales bacterium]|nr:SCP2 sterol-binding domain-containing protein [Acidimicrobiales bacterium]
MARFLSAEWVADLDRAARTSAPLAAATADLDLVIEQVVTGGPDGDVAFHLVLRGGEARAVAGRADAPTITFTQPWAVARAVARGEESAQGSFMSGDLRVGGDVAALIAHQGALAGLDDVFADVRAATEW